MALAADCPFCRIISGKSPSREVEIEDPELHRDLFAFDDIAPKAPHHVLIVPREHIPTLDDLLPEQALLMGRMLSAARDIARARGIADPGYRLVLNTNAAAGQSVFHIHLHLLGGRWMGWPPG